MPLIDSSRHWECYGNVRVSVNGLMKHKIVSELKNMMRNMMVLTGQKDFGASTTWAEKLAHDDYNLFEVEAAVTVVVDAYSSKDKFLSYRDFKNTIGINLRDTENTVDPGAEKAKLYTKSWTEKFNELCEKHGKERIENGFKIWLRDSMDLPVEGNGLFKPLFMEHFSICRGDFKKCIEHTKKFMEEGETK